VVAAAVDEAISYQMLAMCEAFPGFVHDRCKACIKCQPYLKKADLRV
jgi:hypothetical protein